MKTLIDIAEPQMKALEHIARMEKRSRAAVIRSAIEDYLLRQADEKQQDAFGLWRERGVDGLAFQEKIRSEW